MASAVSIRARLALSVSATAFLMTGAPALAQTTPPQPDSAPVVVDDIIVTAQKREQSVQDVPIAVTALSAEALQSRQIDGGSELLRAVPNVTFSKSNFSMYNFSIRGIGTKAVSASSDPAVAVSFNNTPLIRNRLFEQEYLDVARVEVLRGPQGTLYGRNATGGVVNMFPELPKFRSEGFAAGELGNYDSRRGQAMLNVPFGDTFAVRGAFGLADGAEVTTEANPDSIDARGLAELAEAGFTRVSLGMQSAVPHVLASLERTHDLASRFALACRSAGLEVATSTWFDTVTLTAPDRAPEIVGRAAELGIDLRR